jgi:REP element-mobilizing transposase RayT
MPRQPRLNIPGLVHHVMARGIEGCDIFRDEDDREGFLKRLADVVSKPGAPRLYAWTLMSNHFHLLLRAGEEALSATMRRLMTGHAVTYNLRHKRQGHLFQNRYKSVVVEEEPYFLELLRYIHLNPVRCGIVKDLKELATYRYSGHSVIIGRQEYEAQDVESVLMRFSDKRKVAITGYNGFVGDGLNQGRREELRGGGLIRSIGGIAAMMSRGFEERELSDERILGSGDFVESVLRESDNNSSINGKPSIDDVLKEVSEESGIRREQILGPSRSRRVSNARKQFFLVAHERAGATLSMLGRLTGRSHVAVRMAIEEAKYGQLAE